MRFFSLYNIFIAFIFINQANATNIKICLAGSDVKTLPSYGASFINGANLAKLQSPYGKRIEIKPYFYDRKPLEAIRVYHQMVNEGCNAIIGFEYLTDLMLVAVSQANTDIPIFTTYPSTVFNQQFPENIFVFMPKYDFLAKQMFTFLKSRFGKIKNVLLITEVNRNEMQEYKKAYSVLLSEEGVSFDHLDILENDNQMSVKLAKFLGNKQYDYVFLFSTANDASKIVATINNPHTIYIGTEYFGSSTQQTFYVSLKNKNVKAYMVRNLDFLKADELLNHFENEYIKTYKTPPTILSAYAYEAVSIVLKTLQETGSLSTRNIVKIQYQGITGINIHHGHFYRSQHYVILANTPQGYVYEK